ncbi:MAG: efflux RND transporter periplasmic adaptor subunit [Rhodobacteraceae bacterium]|nr:efflux RND transporter periplasmic adaptor subunit [Paracoccaceae bacterium]
MRLVPIITAILVTFGLYVSVFQRDALMAFALGDATTQEQTTAQTETTETVVDVSDAVVSDAIRVVVLRSLAQTIDNAVVLRGQTQADREVQVRAETTAIVISEPLRKGAFVKKGDLLCQLDPGTRNASLAKAVAKLAEAKSHVPESHARLQEAHARLDEAKINNNAASKLSEGGYASSTRVASTQAGVRSAEAGIESAKSGVESTKAGIESAAASVAVAQTELNRLAIKAPFEGVLETDAAELGSLMQPGSLCATVIQLDPIKLVGYVPETNVDRIKVGALAGAELAGGQRVVGKVTFLSRSADPSTRTFLVEIAVPNSNLSIRDGQTADIAISSDGAMAHKLPQSSLTLNNDGQLGVRTVDDDNVVQFMPVELLRDQVDGIWVGGLPEQINVIVTGQDFVIQGVTVNPTYREVLK